MSDQTPEDQGDSKDSKPGSAPEGASDSNPDTSSKKQSDSQPDLPPIPAEALNPKNEEEATETVELEYTGEPMEIGFNVNYLQDALAAADSEEIELHVTDSNSSCLIASPEVENMKFVVMPMRL